MTKFVNLVKSFTADESGAVSSEYAVLLVLIAAALVTVIILLSTYIGGAFQAVVNVLSGAGVAPIVP
jgi:Flp pilus assembly pilin Flp